MLQYCTHHYEFYSRFCLLVKALLLSLIALLVPILPIVITTTATLYAGKQSATEHLRLSVAGAVTADSSSL